jgi:hypothetical protein
MIWKIDGLYEFHLGRLSIYQRLFHSRKRFNVVEAPGFWYFEIGHWRISWHRRWTVWGDHPYRWDNIRLYDQFGTFKRL